jgi:DNA-binding transcriptional regulator YdaS (Cro superfamily)
LKTAKPLDEYFIGEPMSGCWLWLGAVDRDQYGVGWDTEMKRNVRAHRMVYEILVGPFSPDLKLLHRCDNPICVNPDHRFIGTTADNVADCKAKKRHAHGTSHGMNKLTERQILDIRAAEGSHKEIAERFGISPATVTHAKNGRLWKHVEGLEYEKAADAAWRLSSEQVQAIRDAEGTQRSIALEFGVSPSLVSRIKSGQRHANTEVV